MSNHSTESIEKKTSNSSTISNINEKENSEEIIENITKNIENKTYRVFNSQCLRKKSNWIK